MKKVIAILLVFLSVSSCKKWQDMKDSHEWVVASEYHFNGDNQYLNVSYKVWADVHLAQFTFKTKSGTYSLTGNNQVEIQNGQDSTIEFTYELYQNYNDKEYTAQWLENLEVREDINIKW